MNLQELIERYIAYRQTLGEQFKTNASILRAFGRAIGASATVIGVRQKQVEAFLAGAGPVTSAWHARYSALLGFYRYAINRGHVAGFPLPVVQPRRPPGFVPYIYGHDELRRLVQATDCFQRRRCRLEPITLRTVVLLLYGTGLRLNEALTLNREDVDLANSLLTIRHTKFYRTRMVPFNQQLGRAMAEYASRRVASDSLPGRTGSFFAMRDGVRVSHGAMESNFRHLCEHAGIRRNDGARYRPRLHDLRHTLGTPTSLPPRSI
jgi:integrase/recombinase XerD